MQHCSLWAIRSSPNCHQPDKCVTQTEPHCCRDVLSTGGMAHLGVHTGRRKRHLTQITGTQGMPKRANASRIWDRERRLRDLDSVLGDGILWSPEQGRVFSIHFIASNSALWFSSSLRRLPPLATGAWLPTNGQTVIC